MSSVGIFGVGFIAGYFALIYLIARSKNRRVWVWLLFSVFFPGLTLIVLLFAYPLGEEGKNERGVS